MYYLKILGGIADELGHLHRHFCLEKPKFRIFFCGGSFWNDAMALIVVASSSTETGHVPLLGGRPTTCGLASAV